jgi:hypothetical protein
LNGVGELESYAVHPTKKARVCKGSLVPKSVIIESSIDSSIDDTASFNASIKELPEFGQRTLKNGDILIIIKSIFDTAFPNVKIRPISRVIRVGNKKNNEDLAGNRDKSEHGRKNDALSRPHGNNAKELSYTRGKNRIAKDVDLTALLRHHTPPCDRNHASCDARMKWT